MFQGRTAWFSSSVPEEVKAIWSRNAGIQQDAGTADFLFSDDSSAKDTTVFYKGKGDHGLGLAVFKSEWIVDTVHSRNPLEHPIANYLLMEPDCCDAGHNEIGHCCSSSKLLGSKKARRERHDASFSKNEPRTTISPAKSSDDSPSEVNVNEFYTSMSDGFIHIDELPLMDTALRDFVPGKNGFRVKRKSSFDIQQNET